MLNPLFFWIKYRKIKNRFVKIRESFPILYINLKWRAKFQISRLMIRVSDWLNFIHFSGYKYKIRLVSRLREDQALISISTILKFPAQESWEFSKHKNKAVSAIKLTFLDFQIWIILGESYIKRLFSYFFILKYQIKWNAK